MGRDPDATGEKAKMNISIHSPRMGRDPAVLTVHEAYEQFQSTLPAWGETLRMFSLFRYRLLFQSTLPAWGETFTKTALLTISTFQSTLPAWGETVSWYLIPQTVTDFNPLSPHGERPKIIQLLAFDGKISIHSPRMGRDISASTIAPMICDFNPLSPHGERQSNGGL